jgi:hypothetical protein
MCVDRTGVIVDTFHRHSLVVPGDYLEVVAVRR